jgi:hypothetical protein
MHGQTFDEAGNLGVDHNGPIQAGEGCAIGDSP